LSALSSHHDIKASGFSFNNEDDLKNYINQLEKYGQVIISSETSQWETIKKYQINIEPKDLHDLLSFAKLYIGEGATMASEAAILGVPSIYVSNTTRGYLNELEDKYELAYTISEKNKALEKALFLLTKNNLKIEWKQKKGKMLQEKIDVAEFINGVIEERHKL